MNSERYLVAGLHDWSAAAFQILRKLPGEWHFVATPESLNPDELTKLAPRYIFFLHWSTKIPQEIFEKWECIAFHMTDLPYGRGGSPLQNLIQRGHTTTQLSALRVESKFDAGPVYLKAPLSLEGKAEEIYYRAMDLAARMAARIAAEMPQPVAQTGEPVTFRRRKPEESKIPEDATLAGLYDFIRMLDAPGYPRAYLDVGNMRYLFQDAKLIDGKLCAQIEIRRKEQE